jgi:Ca2+-binding EF-hand superfamily protein
MFSSYLESLDLTEFQTIDAYSSLGITTEKHRINKMSTVDDDDKNNSLGVQTLLEKLTMYSEAEGS